MKLFIPEIGTKLTLSKPWTFKLYPERRNELFAKNSGFFKELSADEFEWGGKVYKLSNFKSYYGNPIVMVNLWYHGNSVGFRAADFTIPQGTELIVDRIYIRKGASSFSSVSFRITKNKTLGYSGRFWAKLDDVNTMEIEE